MLIWSENMSDGEESSLYIYQTRHFGFGAIHHYVFFLLNYDPVGFLMGWAFVLLFLSFIFFIIFFFLFLLSFWQM